MKVLIRPSLVLISTCCSIMLRSTDPPTCHGTLRCHSTRRCARLVTGRTARDRTMAVQGRIGIAVAVQAKAMKPRFDSDFEVGAVAAMAMDAAVESSAIDVVMVADQTIDGCMFGMIEVQRQHLCSRQQRFTERDVGTAGDERAEREHRRDDGADDERRMTAEDEAAHGSLVRCRSDTAPAPEEHREATCGHGDEQDAAAVACGVPVRRDYMHGEQCQQETRSEEHT